MENRIKKLRLEHGMTQEQLAKRVNTTKANISMIESGKRNLTASTLQAFADVFNVTTDYLLGKTDNPNSVIIKVADSDGTITEVQHQLLDATKGMSVEDLIKINEYIDFLKSKKKGN